MASLIRGDTLRVLLITLDRETHERVGEILASGAGNHRLYWVSDPALAVARSQEVAPHLILVDGAITGESPATLVGNLVGRAPEAIVLVLVDADALDLVREVTFAGARGFFTKPLRESDVIASIRQLLSKGRDTTSRQRESENPPGRVILCCAPKGGTGRTMLAINTSIAIHKMSGESVALIDADYASPALDVALNLHPDRTIMDLLPRLSRLDDELMSSVLVPHVSGIQTLLAPAPGSLAYTIDLPQAQRVLSQLRRMFDWVIVDLGLPLDETAFAFLDSADQIVVNVLPEMVGLRNIRLMLDQFVERGYPADKIWLVLNRSTIRGGVRLKEIEERVEFDVVQKIPDDQSLATSSVNRGIPIMLSDPRSAVGRSYQALAGKLISALPRNKLVDPEEEASEVGTLLERLRRRIRSTSTA